MLADRTGPTGRANERTIYREYCQKLVDTGHAYRAFETAEELDAERKAQMAAKQPPKYSGPSRRYTQQQVDTAMAEGKPYTIRLRVPHGDAGVGVASTTFHDQLRGDITFDHFNVDDQVLMKSDGFPTYHLANVVDDHLMEHYGRDPGGGVDLVSTPKHVLLYQAFGWELPRFWHMPLLAQHRQKQDQQAEESGVAGVLPAGGLSAAGGAELPGADGRRHGGSRRSRRSISRGLDARLVDICSLPDMVERFDFANGFRSVGRCSTW